MSTTEQQLTPVQKLTLSEFARHGGFLVPGNDEVRGTCHQLTDRKLLRPQPFLDGNSLVRESVVEVAYQVTAKGRKVAESFREVSNG